MWRGLLTEEENVKGMTYAWERGYAVLTTPTAWFMIRRYSDDNPIHG